MGDGVSAGMSKREVRHALGRPTERTSLGDGPLSFNSVVGRVPRMESWRYADTPGAGETTLISFLRGRVDQVRVQRDPG